MRDNVRYNLRSQFEFLGSSDSTSQFQIGRNSLRVFNAKVWNMVPTKIKNSTTLNNLKEKIRKREPINFNRKIYLLLIQNIGYTNKMLSEFNFSCFEKPTSVSSNVPARLHAFCFSCNS